MLNATEKEMSVLRIEMRKLIEPVVNDVASLQESIGSLSGTVAAQSHVNYSDINNILDNGLPEWSVAAYAAPGVNPADPGDGNFECHNFYRQSATDVDLLKTAAEALKAVGHSVVEDPDAPIWDKVNGTIMLGGTARRWDLYAPVPNDIVFPGQTFLFQLEARLATDDPTPEDRPQMYAGFYDNTPGEQNYIEGGAFMITGEIFGPLGTPGRSVDYQILAKTDSGEQALSNVLNFPHAPDVFTGANHPRIHFAGVAGFIQFLIYRRIGSEFVHQYTVQNTIEGSYFDVGKQPIAVVTGFPAVTTTSPRAYAVTTNFQPFSVGWTRYVWTIFVPTTYDRNVTQSGMQFLRFGLTKTVDVSRQILIRRLGLSQGDGSWARSPNDVRAGAHSSPSTTAAGSAGGSGPGIEPPPPPGTGGGGGGCVLVESKIDLAEGSSKQLKELKHEYLHSGGVVHGRVRKVKCGHVSRLYRITTANGCDLGCSFDHPLITDSLDHYGTRAKKLKKHFERGEEVRVLTRPLGGVVESSVIIKFDEEYGDFLVGEPHMDGCHIYIANGFLGHNKISIENIT